MHHVHIFVALIVGISQLIWSESFGKVRIQVLTFRFPCLNDLSSRSQQLKVKRRLHHVYKSPFDTCQIERYLEPDIVLTGNEGGYGWGSPWLFYRKLPSSPGKAVARSSQFLVFVKVKLTSIFVPRAPAPKEGGSISKTSQA